MPLQALCAARATVPVLSSASPLGIRVVSGRSSHSKDFWVARGGRSLVISVAGGGLLLKGRWGAPTGSLDAVSFGGGVIKSQQHTDLLSVPGVRGTNLKRWVLQSSNSEEGQEIVEKENTQSSEENKDSPEKTSALLCQDLFAYIQSSLLATFKFDSIFLAAMYET
ncbi:unnamed protein product [Calypogeia fissa]